MKQYYVYIAANKNNTVLYVGMTCDINRRMFEHVNKSDPKSFTAKYKINKLVYIEVAQYVNDAIAREKQIKSLSHNKKIDLVVSANPNFDDLLSSGNWF